MNTIRVVPADSVRITRELTYARMGNEPERVVSPHFLVELDGFGKGRRFSIALQEVVTPLRFGSQAQLGFRFSLHHLCNAEEVGGPPAFQFKFDLLDPAFMSPRYYVTTVDGEFDFAPIGENRHNDAMDGGFRRRALACDVAF